MAKITAGLRAPRLEPRAGDRVLTPSGAIARVTETHPGKRGSIEATVEWPDGEQARFTAANLRVVERGA